MNIKSLCFCIFFFGYLLPGIVVSKEITDVSPNRLLEKLVSQDSKIRGDALRELSREFGSNNVEPKYQNHGEKLFPYMYSIINNLKDPYAHNAVETLYYMSFYHELLKDDKFIKSDKELETFVEEYKHYPNPVEYKSFKSLLVNVLKESPDYRSRYWSAKVLANGFNPVSEIDELLLKQITKEKIYKVQRGIMEGIGHLSARKDYDGTEFLSGFGMKAGYDSFVDGRNAGGGSRNGMLLADQQVVFEGQNWELIYTINPLSDEKYILNYYLHQNFKNSGRTLNELHNFGKVIGSYDMPLAFNVKKIHLKIEATLVVTRINKCLKKDLSYCYRWRS